MTKWGLEDEITKGHTKRGKDGGETPFDLLRALLADGKDKQAAALFREYALKFKGKQQLSWSNGLKGRLSVSEMSDSEILATVDDKAEFLCQIGLNDWRRVLRVNGQGQLVAIAARQGWEGVAAFLVTLSKAKKRVAVVAESAGGQTFGVVVGGIGGIAPDVQPLSREVPSDEIHEVTSAPANGIELSCVQGEQSRPQPKCGKDHDGRPSASIAERSASRLKDKRAKAPLSVKRRDTDCVPLRKQVGAMGHIKPSCIKSRARQVRQHRQGPNQN